MTNKTHEIKIQEGPLLMSPKGSLICPSSFSDVSPSILHPISFNTINNHNVNAMDSDYDEVQRIVYLNGHQLIGKVNLPSRNGTTTKDVRNTVEEAKDTTIYSKRDLFGGTITVELPDSFNDLSIYRQVPDHQEVLVDSYSNATIIVEILDFEDSISDESAASYYFDDLSQANEVSVIIFIHSGCITIEFLNLYVSLSRQ